MSAVKNARWVCPVCNTGCLAPTRPRADDTRRYCLRCSEKSGRLVRRIAPALEKAREQRVALRTLVAKKKAETAKKRAAAYYTVAGLDLRGEMVAMLRADVFKGGSRQGVLHRADLPTLRVRRHRDRPRNRASMARSRASCRPPTPPPPTPPPSPLLPPTERARP